MRYTLQCLECSNQTFNWEAAQALAGPPLSPAPKGEKDTAPSQDGSTNSIVVILSVTLVSVLVPLAALGLVYNRRRRVAEERDPIRAAQELAVRAVPPQESRRRSGRSRRHFKPPTQYVVGEATDGLPPKSYHGPIVVLNYGEGEDEDLFYVDGVYKEAAAVAGREGDGASSSSDDAPGPSCSLADRRMLRWSHLAIAYPDLSAVANPAPGEEGAAEASPTQPEGAEAAQIEEAAGGAQSQESGVEASRASQREEGAAAAAAAEVPRPPRQVMRVQAASGRAASRRSTPGASGSQGG